MTSGDLVRPDGRAVLFRTEELACQHCGMIVLQPGFGDQLVRLRMTWGRAMVITSGCRCRAHNRAVKGASNSMHICDDPGRPGGACAVDVAMSDLALAGALASLAWSMGWTIGVPAPAQGFLHLDRRGDLPGQRPILFGY